MAPTGRSYEVISADSHVVEPPTLWEDWLPKKYLDYAPKLVKDEDGGDAWIYQEGMAPAPLGLVACVGIEKEDMKWTGLSYGDNVHPSVYDGTARLEVLDTDGVDAEFLYPPQRAVGCFMKNPDSEIHLAGLDAYNRWLSEGFCAADPDRLFGVYQIPNLGVETAVAELKKAKDMGYRGAVIGMWPTGSQQLTGEDDPFWAAAEDLEMPISIHFRLASQGAGHIASKGGALATGAVAGIADFPVLMVDLIFDGVFDRFPGLKMVGVEVGVGWIPHAAEMMDDRYWRNRGHAKWGLKKLPSQYVKDNWLATFIVDRIGIEMRHAVGLKNMSWSTDFPHHGNDYPYSRQTIEQHFVNVPEAEKRRIVCDNAAELYGLV